MHTFLAIDIGASSGRLILGRLADGRLDAQEIHRFANTPVRLPTGLHWDILRLWHEVTAGLAKLPALLDAPLDGIGIDTWAVDYALLDEAGRLLGNPHHYRDQRTAGMPESLARSLPPERVYARTGIQQMPINTLYQLASMRAHGDRTLDHAAHLLLIPDLFHYWMTGQLVAEYTNASTTQLLDARERRWAGDLLDALELPARILPDVVAPGTALGMLRPELAAACGLHHAAPVYATATHDTASAVAAVPGLDAHSAYISSGTWSLVGVELDAPILSEQAQRLNFTNEGGVAGSIRLLKNVGGLWLLQECQRQWQREGRAYGWDELGLLAEAAPPLRSLVDPDAPDFLSPDDMPAAIRAYCRRSGQPEPAEAGAVVRCCMESLALAYRRVIEQIEALTGRQIRTIRMVGGGTKDATLCQLTADACGREVVAGPAEATALGNMLVQAVASGALPSIQAGRAAVARSAPQRAYAPRTGTDWGAALAQLYR